MTGAFAEGEIFLNENGDGLESDKFEFLYVQDKKLVEAEGLPADANGMLGVARAGKKLKLNTSSTPKSGKRSILDIFDAMEDDDKKMFSTRFSSDHFSWVDWGALNSAAVEDPAKMLNQTVYNDFFWSMGMRGIKIGDKFEGGFEANDQAVLDKDGGLYTILDTTGQHIMISDLYFNDFLKQFFAAHKVALEDWKAEDGVVSSKCTSFKDLSFLMGDVWIHVPAESYYKKTGTTCKFIFKGIDAPFNIMGQALYMDYYVTHNFGENASIAWSPNGRKMREDPIEAADWKPTEMYKVELATWDAEDPEKMTMIISVILAAATLGGFIFWAVVGKNNGTFTSTTMALVIAGGLVAAGVVYFIATILVYEMLTPGETFKQTEDADVAIGKVKASHVGIFSLLAFAVYKLTGKSEEKATRTESVEETEEEVVSNYLM